MNTQTQEALKMASLFMAKESLTVKERHQLLQACKEALAQPAQEPVAWTDEYKNFLEWDKESLCDKAVCKDHEAIPLYTHPAPSWQVLSDVELLELLVSKGGTTISYFEFARAIEQALKEKNT